MQPITISVVKYPVNIVRWPGREASSTLVIARKSNQRNFWNDIFKLQYDSTAIKAKLKTKNAIRETSSDNSAKGMCSMNTTGE